MYRISTALVLAFIFVGAGCKRSVEKAAPEAKADSSEQNSHYERLIAGKVDEGDRAEEARGWLDPKNTKNVLWKTTRTQTLQFVDDLYEAGATKVYAVYAPKDGAIPVNLCAELLIVLPTDSGLRKKVIKAYNKIDKQIWGSDHETLKDDGQKYLELNMDS